MQQLQATYESVGKSKEILPFEEWKKKFEKK